MKREDVYKLIDQERDYQDTARKEQEKDTRSDSEKSREAFLLFIENKLNAAKYAAYYLNDDEIQDNVRKIAALCVASIEAFGAPTRTK